MPLPPSFGNVQSAATIQMSKKDERRQRAERLQERQRALRPLKEKKAALEAEIAALEVEKSQLLEDLCKPEIIADQRIYPQKVKRSTKVEKQLSFALAEWEKAGQRLAEVEAQLAAVTEGD